MPSVAGQVILQGGDKSPLFSKNHPRNRHTSQIPQPQESVLEPSIIPKFHVNGPRPPPLQSAPVPEPSPSTLSAFQDPPDRLRLPRKYSPLEAFGLIPGERSPTTSSVNLPSQNSVSASSSVHIIDTKLITTLPAGALRTIGIDR